MEFLWNLFHQIYDVELLVRAGGLVLLTIIVFVETGLLIGFFLPGDSLLVTAGIFAAQGSLDLLTLNLALSAAAIAGDTVGYRIGYAAGPKFSPARILFFSIVNTSFRLKSFMTDTADLRSSSPALFPLSEPSPLSWPV